MSSRKLVMKTLKTLHFLLKNDKCLNGRPFKSDEIFHRIYSVLASQLSGLNYIFYAPQAQVLYNIKFATGGKNAGG